jgi:hypothetical protein
MPRLTREPSLERRRRANSVGRVVASGAAFAFYVGADGLLLTHLVAGSGFMATVDEQPPGTGAESVTTQRPIVDRTVSSDVVVLSLVDGTEVDCQISRDIVAADMFLVPTAEDLLIPYIDLGCDAPDSQALRDRLAAYWT